MILFIAGMATKVPKKWVVHTVYMIETVTPYFDTVSDLGTVISILVSRASYN